MTVAQLIARLQKLPQDAPVVSTGADKYGYAEPGVTEVEVGLASERVWSFQGDLRTVSISGKWES